jgi:3-oxoacyl-[acyl-carrier-protein] synthase II
MSEIKERVFITSLGVTSSMGCDEASFRDGLFSGKSGVKSIRGRAGFSEDFPIPYAGVIDEDLETFKLIPKEVVDQIKSSSGLSRSWKCTLLSLEQIFNKIPKLDSIDAIVYGAPDGSGYEVVQDAFQSKTKENFDLRLLNGEGCHQFLIDSIKSFYNIDINPDKIYTLNSACATGNQAIGMAFQRIQTGSWKRALVGAVDTRCTPANMMNFHLLKALTTADVDPKTASRPFDLTRSGFVRGEAAGMLLLESESAQKESNNPILAEVAGYASTTDAFRLTDPRPDAQCLVQAMDTAIKSAKILKTDINYINAHGTSTSLNDKTETAAIKKLFGDHAKELTVSSLKSQIGHSTVAAGVLESIACTMMLQEQKAAPTINLQVSDPECDLDYVPLKSRDQKINYILNNNIGFGGQNICLILKNPESK